ncbi:iron-sulfur cluster biosynthesis family protein [Lactococcus termiticola]|uniref:Core domain-containing protein n=1 Tax=Lactococcus termiticola TaxID=2169526 RepID=A0A2R5HHG7_9LACT|nr:iron-sulfur cluster biosynthesis family protein [Lactococcus termiticola]GBG97507.1 hypothetical protein NtB2_01653 [Lactococcus termiticola]
MLTFTFDEQVAEKMKALEPASFVLDFDHTLSESLAEVDACAGGISRWRIVAVDKDAVPADFDSHLDSEFGPIYYKSIGEMFFHEDLKAKVEGSYNLISLKTPGETLSNNLLVVDFRGKKAVG